MSLFSELVKKKKQLKSCETVVTSVTGNKYVESRNNFGELEMKKLPETSPGFVIDERLDLQIAEILKYLYLSSQDPTQDDAILLEKGITHVLSIGVDLPTCDRSIKIKFVKIDLLDEPDADLTEVLRKCFDFINAAKREDEKNRVLVHCNAGYSRAPTVVIGYLMKTFGYSLNEAFQMVKEKRNVKPNEGFWKQLMKLEEQWKSPRDRPE